MRHPFLSPNSTFSDILICLFYILFPWKWSFWRKGNYFQKLEDKFKEYLRIKHAVTFDSGRSSLYAIIKALEIKKGDEVLLQVYTCVVVPNAIIFAGAKPIYVDIEADTFNIDPLDLEKKITKKSKAIIIQNTFGKPADYLKIQTVAQKHNLKIIEDCAHSLGAEINGQKIGSIGDAAMFSFGRDKIISGIYGGMAVTNNDKLGVKIRKIQQNLLFPKRWTVFQHLTHPLIFAIALPLYDFINLGKLIIVLAQKFKLVSKAILPLEKKSKLSRNQPAKLPNAMAQIVLNQFKNLEKFNEHRITLARFYTGALKDSGFTLPKIFNTEKNVFLRYTILTSEKEKIMQGMRLDGVYLGDWYDTVIAPKDVDTGICGYEKGSCPKAELVAEQTINLPTSYKVNPEMAKKIVIGLLKFKI